MRSERWLRVERKEGELLSLWEKLSEEVVYGWALNDKKQANARPREHSICRRKCKGLGQAPNSVFDAPENSVNPARKGFADREWANSKVAVSELLAQESCSKAEYEENILLLRFFLIVWHWEHELNALDFGLLLCTMEVIRSASRAGRRHYILSVSLSPC